MEFGIIGLGKLGGSLAEQALNKNFTVHGYTKDKVPAELTNKGFKLSRSIDELVKAMTPPRKIFLCVPAGPMIDLVIQELTNHLDSGDIIIDSGNSYWGDSIRRAKKLKKKEIILLDMGTSGGIGGAQRGACFMVGGEKDGYDSIEPILNQLAANKAYSYIGPSGSGHFVKLVHNGIEFGMLQAIGEGMTLLEKFQQHLKFDMEGVFKCYRNGSVIRSWLIDLMDEQYQQQKGFENISSFVEDTGEVNWLLEDAIQSESPIPVISQGVMELFRSRDAKKTGYKSVAMMRHGFGGHPLGENDYIKNESKEGRVGTTYFEQHFSKVPREIPNEDTLQ